MTLIMQLHCCPSILYSGMESLNFTLLNTIKANPFSHHDPPENLDEIHAADLFE